MKRFFCSFALAVIALHPLGGYAAWAQTAPIPIEIVKPDSWQVSDNATDGLAAEWVDPKTESRIEIRIVRIVRDEHADTLREAFNDQLLDSGFKSTAPSVERVVPLVNATKRTGYWSEYEFTGVEVPICVVTFEFTVSGAVVYVVGYFARTNRADGVDVMQSIISQMVDKV